MPARGLAADWFAIPLFMGGYLLAAWLWQVPHAVALVYAASSLACAVAYALDKAAARTGRWRISEKTLLLLGLMGGWPGAIVAQQGFRHKTSKQPFRAAFWFTVVLNVAGFAAMVSPQLQGVFHFLR